MFKKKKKKRYVLVLEPFVIGLAKKFVQAFLLHLTEKPE